MSLFVPPLNKLRRLASPIRTSSHVAVRKWQHSPAEEANSPGAIFLADELDRITGISAHSTMDFERVRLYPRRRKFEPTYLCELENVVVSQGDLFKGPFKRMVVGSPRSLAVRIDDVVDDAGIFCSTWLGWRYFGHWLNEDFADRAHTAHLGEGSELEQSRTPHQTAYHAMFGLGRKTIPLSTRIKRMTLVQTDLGSRFRVEAWHKMTERINALYPSTPHVGCMLMRGSSGQRRSLVNEAEVAEWLRARGFRILEPETLALPDLLGQLSGSRLIVGVEGSQLAHGFHCLSSPGAMVVLQPPNRFGLSDKDRCDRKGLRYAFSIGVPSGEGFRIELASLEKVLEMTLNELDRAN